MMCMKSEAKHFHFIIFIATMLSLGIHDNGFPQRASTDEVFIDLGPISFSSNFVLSPDLDHITFRIKNQTTRTIDKMYGWVYHYAKGTVSNPRNLTLVNNPHRGGTVTLGQPHRPGEIAEWRFPLIKTLPSTDIAEKFTLRVTLKGIFYPRIEPPSLLKDNKK